MLSGLGILVKPDPRLLSRFFLLATKLARWREERSAALLLLPRTQAEPRQEADLELTSALTRLALPSVISTPVPATLSQKAMIWTEKEAVRKQVTVVVSCGFYLAICLNFQCR